MVAEAGLEPTTSGLWARRASNCSTPRYFVALSWALWHCSMASLFCQLLFYYFFKNFEKGGWQIEEVMLNYLSTQESARHRGVEQLEARRAHNPEVVGSSPASATRTDTWFDTKSNQVFLFISWKKLELSQGMGVIPTFVFYVVLDMAIMRLQPIAWRPERAFLSFIYRLSFR